MPLTGVLSKSPVGLATLTLRKKAAATPGLPLPPCKGMTRGSLPGSEPVGADLSLQHGPCALEMLVCLGEGTGAEVPRSLGWITVPA